MTAWTASHRGGSPRANALRLASCTLLLTLALPGCGGKPPETRAFLFLFDFSGSAGGSDVRSRYRDWASTALQPEAGKRSRLGPGDALMAGLITDNSLVQADFPLKVEVTPMDPSKDNPLMAQSRAVKETEGLEKKLDAVFSADPRSKATKIMDAMVLAQQVLKALKRDRSVIVVFSDMVEESETYDFRKEKLSADRIGQIIAAEKKSGRLPDLAGVRVYVWGAGGGSYQGMTSAQILGIRDFWLRYFKEAGADLPAERYLSAPVGFHE